MKVFVITGKARSGKSTFSNLLKEELQLKGYKPCILRITEPLYNYAKHFNWDGNDLTKPRDLLQQIGIDLIKDKMNKKTFLLDRLFEDIEVLSNFFNVFIISDARLIDEFEMIRNKYEDVTLIKIERNNYTSDLTIEQKNHITEQELDMFDDYDYVIENNGIDYLKDKVQEVISNYE